MMHYYGDYMMGFGLLFWLISFAVFVFIIWLIFWLIKNETAKNKDKSIDMLKKRYAKGEISKQEFEEKKKDLLG